MNTQHEQNNNTRAGVRRTSLTVLGHLILNDMMKVKGNIARIALRLVDDEEEVSAHLQLLKPLCIGASKWHAIHTAAMT